MSDEKYHSFNHGAMATYWKILISSDDKPLAAQAAAAAFAEIDRVEAAISRFIDSSDIARINAASAGVVVRIGIHALECLQAAAQITADTSGAFDVTIGPLMAVWRNPDKSPRQPTKADLEEARAKVGIELLDINESDITVRVRNSGVRVDMGGIGKGYAADKAADVLREWEIDRALISGGTSTVLALEAPEGENGWELGVGGVGNEPEAPYTLDLRNGALSGSGIHIQGSHIMNPHTGQPVEDRLSAWSLTKTGADADALSTAFMIMPVSDVEAYVSAHKDTSAMLATKEGGQIVRKKFGNWPGLH